MDASRLMYKVNGGDTLELYTPQPATTTPRVLPRQETARAKVEGLTGVTVGGTRTEPVITRFKPNGPLIDTAANGYRKVDAVITERAEPERSRVGCPGCPTIGEKAQPTTPEYTIDQTRQLGQPTPKPSENGLTTDLKRLSVAGFGKIGLIIVMGAIAGSIFFGRGEEGSNPGHNPGNPRKRKGGVPCSTCKSMGFGNVFRSRTKPCKRCGSA